METINSEKGKKGKERMEDAKEWAGIDIFLGILTARTISSPSIFVKKGTYMDNLRTLTNLVSRQL